MVGTVTGAGLRNEACIAVYLPVSSSSGLIAADIIGARGTEGKGWAACSSAMGEENG